MLAPVGQLTWKVVLDRSTMVKWAIISFCIGTTITLLVTRALSRLADSLAVGILLATALLVYFFFTTVETCIVKCMTNDLQLPGVQVEESYEFPVLTLTEQTAKDRQVEQIAEKIRSVLADHITLPSSTSSSSSSPPSRPTPLAPLASLAPASARVPSVPPVPPSARSAGKKGKQASAVLPL